MNIMKPTLFCVALFIQLGTLSAQVDDSLYTIYDTQKKTEITLQELANALGEVDVAFFGEEHNDSVAHVLQYELLKAMNERYDGMALSMEMFVSDDQLVLNEYLADLITEQNLSKDAVLWANYDDYRPLVEYAKEEG